MSKLYHHKIRYSPESPMKEKQKKCWTCCGMSWRVEGTKCRACGLLYAPEVINQETCGVEVIRSLGARDDFIRNKSDYGKK